jgi:hypothetical protein
MLQVAAAMKVGAAVVPWDDWVDYGGGPPFLALCSRSFILCSRLCTRGLAAICWQGGRQAALGWCTALLNFWTQV